MRKPQSKQRPGGRKPSPGKGKGKGRPRTSGGKGSSGRPKAKGDGPALSKVEQQVYKKAQGIQKRSGIPFEDALEIAARGTSVSLKKFNVGPTNTKLDSIAAQYELPRSIAGNVVSGNVPLEKAVLRNKLRQNLEANRHRSCLIDAMESDEEIELCLLGNKTMTGKVVDTGAYRFHFKRTPEGKKQTRKMEYLKLKMKYGYPPALAKFIHEKRRVDEDLKKESIEPPQRIIERRMVKNEKLQRYLLKRLHLLIKTYDGDMFEGRLSWWGQYELGLDLGSGVELTFFRHAIYLVQPF